jgi:hypothetical protein
MGLLGGFVRSVQAAAKRAGQGFQEFLSKAGGKFAAAMGRGSLFHQYQSDPSPAARRSLECSIHRRRHLPIY